MSDQTTNAVIAILLGSVVAIVLLVPVAAYQYRLDGRLGPADLAILLSGAVYGLALWTYTLLPVPVADSYRCQGKNLDPLGSLRGIWADDPGGALGLLRDPAFLQVALNVLLFVPLGFYLRVILRRGVVTAALVGFAVSLLIETTQLTGVWHLYDCPYRLFDVDDLVVNTLGAIGGSLLSAAFVRRRRGEAPPLPTTISNGRRIVGLVSDAVFVLLLGAGVVMAYRAFCLYGPGELDQGVQDTLQLAVPYAVEALSVLAVGRTIGEHTISVRAIARRRSLTPVSRLVKLLVGITPAFALVLLGGGWVWVGLPVFAIVTVLAVLLTPDSRGLSHLVAGMDLVIAAEEAFEPDRERVEP